MKISHSETLRPLGVQHIVQPAAITAARYSESAPPLSVLGVSFLTGAKRPFVHLHAKTGTHSEQKSNLLGYK